MKQAKRKPRPVHNLNNQIYSDEETEVLQNIQAYRQRNRCGFVTHTEVLRILKQMGYRRTAPARI